MSKQSQNVVVLCLHSYVHFIKEPLEFREIYSLEDLSSCMEFVDFFTDDCYVKGVYATFYKYNQSDDQYDIETKFYGESIDVYWQPLFENDAKAVITDE